MKTTIVLTARFSATFTSVRKYAVKAPYRLTSFLAANVGTCGGDNRQNDTFIDAWLTTAKQQATVDSAAASASAAASSAAVSASSVAAASSSSALAAGAQFSASQALAAAASASTRAQAAKSSASQVSGGVLSTISVAALLGAFSLLS